MTNPPKAHDLRKRKKPNIRYIEGDPAEEEEDEVCIERDNRGAFGPGGDLGSYDDFGNN